MATNQSPFIQEIDLRHEFQMLFSGGEFVKKGETYIYRKVRIKDGSKEKCSCWNNISNEGRSDCTHCDGIGYLWDDVLLKGHMWMPRNTLMPGENSYKSYGGKAGRLNNSEWLMATSYSLDFSDRDIIYRPEVDDSGKVILPIKPKKTYYITSVYRYGFDFDREDFTVLGLSEV